MVAARAGDTAKTRFVDIVRGYAAWPEPYAGRVLRNDFFARWHGREEELEAALDTETAIYERAFREGDCETAAIFAGEAVDLIDAVVPAGELVQRIGAEAEALLRGGPALLA
jgi:nitronate monooxygenase